MPAYQERISHGSNNQNSYRGMRISRAAATTSLVRAQHRSLVAFARPWVFLLALLTLLIAAPAAHADTQFAPIQDLYFSTTYAVDTPMSQVLNVTSTGDPINFAAVASTNTGGPNWLTIDPNDNSGGLLTPFGLIVSATPDLTLAPGTYTGQIVLTANGVLSETVNVMLVVHSASDTYFDQIAGGLSFSMLTSGNTPPAQALQVRNAGGGSLAWTATTSTEDGGNWLTISSASGTAPSNLSVSVNPANLPGAGVLPGSYAGRILFNSSGDKVSVPIVINVGDSVYPQVNPLSFQKVYAGPNPISQEITLASTGTNRLTFIACVWDSTGGSWLQIDVTGCSNGATVTTPVNIAVSVNPDVSLAAGTYVAQIIIRTYQGVYFLPQTLTIPVSLTVNPPAATYFDNVAGALNFSMVTGGAQPPSQDIQIRGLGPNALAWNATVTTADGGNWLTASASSGNSPSILSISADPTKIPGAGSTTQTLVGQIALTSLNNRVTIPASFSVGGSVFQQVPPLNFVMPFAGADPLSQVITIASTGAPIAFGAVAIPGTGGNWLSIDPDNYASGPQTPLHIAVNVSPAAALSAGVYTSEILVYEEHVNEAISIPVTLTIEPKTAVFFDALPGQLTFSMATGGIAPSAHPLPIRGIGGTFEWTAAATTADGGNWLSISTESGSTPSEPKVSVNPANLPGAGFLAGTYTGAVSLKENGLQVSVPVSFIVGANVFQQINPLTFTMVQGGATPLPQVLTAASTGASFNFVAAVYSSTGGSWLSIDPSDYRTPPPMPFNIAAEVNAAAGLAAGTYSAQIALFEEHGTQSMVVPVTLNVLPKTATMFDTLPGQLTFSMATNGAAPPSLPLEIRNAGGGTLTWTASVSSADGGAWLSVSAGSGTAPSVPQVKVDPTMVAGGGAIAGTFTGQVVLDTAGDRVTIPVIFTIGDAVYQQISGLHFNMVAGGPAPLPQLFSLTSTGHFTGASSPEITTVGSPFSSTGGDWLTITPTANQLATRLSTPLQVVVSPNPAKTLAAGTYTSEIIFRSNPYFITTQSIVVPITLTVNPPTATYFADMQGAVTFSATTGSGTNPAAQAVPIRVIGTGVLHWTASSTTADGGKWLHLSAAAGTAPDSLGISISVADLPASGAVDGEFSGQVLLVSGATQQTIPVEVYVGTTLFSPVPTIAFTKQFGAANPGLKEMDITSSGGNIGFTGLAATATGGNWFSIYAPYLGYGVDTPYDVAVTPTSAPGLAPGFYTGETIYTSSDGTQGLVVPVTLNVTSVPAAAPVISLHTGTYTGVQTVTLKDATPGATIYYTLNGKSPTNASTKYTGPIKISINEKLEAVAYAPGDLPSAVASSTYVIVVNTPAASVKSGTYPKAFTVTLSDAMAGSTIYYTTNGATPTAASTKYIKGKTIAVSTNETIKAIALAPGCHASAVASAAYQLQTAKPVIKPAGGSILKGKTVTITDATKGAVIYYGIRTTKGTGNPTIKYTKPIPINASETIVAIATAPKYVVSPTASAIFTVK